MSKATETVLTLSMPALAHNYTFLKSKLQSNTKFLAVVKAVAYGSDALAIAQKLVHLGVDYFAVAYTDEGVALRKGGITTPILVLHPQPSSFETLIAYCLEPNIYSAHVLQNFTAVAKEQQQTHYPIHLKFNTGLNRLGFAPEKAKAVAETIEQENALRLVSVFSHLAASEDPNEVTFTKAQITQFKHICSTVETTIGRTVLKHLCNTSGLLNYPEAHFDMVRPGIGLYGYGNNSKIDQQLQAVGTLKTIISQLHTLAPGTSVGYNRAFISEQNMVSATLPIGHADGIRRQYGHRKGMVWVNGQKAEIIGNVCMDMLMIDVTDIPCKEGDEVIIFGGPYSAEAFATKGNTISYELLTGIAHRVKRELSYT